MEQDTAFCEVECTIPREVEQMVAQKPPAILVNEAACLFGVLAERSRILILRALKGGQELCVCEVAALLDSSTAAVSHHLRKMKDAGVLTNRSEGKLVYYSVKDTRVEALLDVVFAL